jgi:hypothetical protein
MTRSSSGRSRTIAAAVFTTGIVLGAGIAAATSAEAASAESTVGYYTTSGIEYANQSVIIAPENGYDGYAYSSVWTTDGDNVNAG